MSTETVTPENELQARLTQILGADHLITDADERAYYSMDVYEAVTPAAFVAQPGNAEELAATVAAATAAGYSVVPRGGGLSYTAGYLPSEPDSVIIDMRRLNRIIEINTEDMYVTVECGCSWKALNEALAEKGVRTPYWGPLSGIEATIGGALSQNSVFFGSGIHGSAAEQVLSLDVVLADGSIVTTGGSAGIEGGTPFFKHYGPDLTGLFTADTGAMGFKAVATLKLIRAPRYTKFVAYSFDTHQAFAKAMSEISRAGVAVECFGFDPALQNARVLGAGDTFKDDLSAFFSIIRQQGLINAARVAVAGRKFVSRINYGVHLVCEHDHEPAVDWQIRRCREICEAAGGKECPPSLPQVLHAVPFAAPNSMLGPIGERWVPVHGIVPHSKAEEAMGAVIKLFEEHSERMKASGLRTGFLCCTISHQGFLIEPVLFWKDARLPYHERRLAPDYLAKLQVFPADEVARALVAELREKIARLFMQRGGVHFQIGKSYPYREGRKPESWALIDKVKSAVDPARRVNPGSLGLD